MVGVWTVKKRTGVVGVDCEGKNMVGVDWEFKKKV
jgi:hypothetical protein